VKATKLLLLSTLVTLAPSCKHVTVPDVVEWQTAGMLAAGMDGASTGHDATYEKNFAETKQFLEDGAICLSLEDRTKEKTALQELCYAAGDNCSYEQKQSIARMARKKAK
jgi:hypothetical protein